MFAVVGILGSRMLQREAFPPVNFATVVVSTFYPGASPEEVADKITKPIEDELRGIGGIKDVRSTSQSEQSSVKIRIDIDDANPKEVVNDIQRAVQRATAKLPPDLLESPLVMEIKADEIPVLELAIVGSNEGRSRDRLAEDLKEDLEDVAGISSVRLSGYRERQIQILLDPKKLQANLVGIAEITRALSSRIKDIPAGFTRNNQSISQVRLVGKITTPSEVEDLVVRSNDSGRALKVKDLGRVVEGSEQASVLVRIDGEAATLLVATKKQGSDALTAINQMKTSLAGFEKNLPDGYRIVIYNDEGRRIENRLNIVFYNAIGGLLVVLLVLFIFLPGKVGFFSALSLPICTLVTLCFMVFAGANFNIITMLALIICLGNLVDNSVVISEHYARLRFQGMNGPDAAIKAAQQFWIPFTASTITIIAAFLPMLVTKGVMGQFIRWIPIVVSIALIASLIEAVTLLPARLQFLNPKSDNSAPDARSTGFSRLEERWARIIRWTLKRRVKTLTGLSLLIISGVFVTVQFNRFELFPSEGDEYYALRFDLEKGASIDATDRAGKILSEAAAKILGPEKILTVISRAGVQQTDPGDPQTKTGENVGLILVAIKPEIAPDLNIAKTLAALKEIPKPEGVEKLLVETIQNGPPVGKPLTITLRSSNYDSLSAATNEMLAEIGKISGVENLEKDEAVPPEEFRFKIDDVGSNQSLLNLEAIGLHTRTALEGFRAAELTQNAREFAVLIRFDDAAKESISNLEETSVLNTRGNLVPLRRLGNFEKTASPVVRKNYNFKRSITITGEVDVKKITSAALNSKSREVYASISKKYPGIVAVFGGEEESTNESLQSLAVALVMAIFGIFATLVFTFRSFSAPLLILSTIPLGLVGVFYSFAINQRPLSFLAFIGVIGLSGVVINSAIILVDYILELRANTKSNESLEDILVRASSERLRAVLATGLTTVVGLIPTAFGMGGYDPILVPMTLALSWGMIIGTLLTLIWIPSGYMVLANLKEKLRQRFS